MPRAPKSVKTDKAVAKPPPKKKAPVGDKPLLAGRKVSATAARRAATAAIKRAEKLAAEAEKATEMRKAAESKDDEFKARLLEKAKHQRADEAMEKAEKAMEKCEDGGRAPLRGEHPVKAEVKAKPKAKPEPESDTDTEPEPKERHSTAMFYPGLTQAYAREYLRN